MALRVSTRWWHAALSRGGGLRSPEGEGGVGDVAVARPACMSAIGGRRSLSVGGSSREGVWWGERWLELGRDNQVSPKQKGKGDPQDLSLRVPEVVSKREREVVELRVREGLQELTPH